MKFPSSRNNDIRFKEILNEMKDHPCEVLRNTAEYLASSSAPNLYLMAEDLKPNEIYEYGDGRCYRFCDEGWAATAGFDDIHLQPKYYYLDDKYDFDSKGKTLSVSKDYKFSNKDYLFVCLAHEANHIINNSIFKSGLEFALTINGWKRNDKDKFYAWVAKHEYHGYHAGQGAVYGYLDDDIRATIKKTYISEEYVDLAEQQFQLDLNFDNRV